MSDKPVYRMSEVGKCPRALSAQRLGYEPEPAPGWLDRAAEEGKWHEDRIVNELANENIQVLNRQMEVTLSYQLFNLVGHIDGIAIKDHNPDTQMLLEIKSMSQFEFDRWMKQGFEGFPEYGAQLTCYMGATGLTDALYLVKNRSSGYIDRRELIEAPFELVDIIDELEQIEVSVAKGKLHDVQFDPQHLQCRRCEYKHLCIPEPKELTPIEDSKLALATSEWRQGKLLVEQGQKLIDSAKDIMETHTRATNILKWQHSNLAIQLVHYRETKTYPKANLLKVFTEEQLEPASEVKEAYDQLRITDLEENNSV